MVVSQTEAPSGAASGAPPFKRVAAFAAIYLLWGSTYLAIRYAVEALPPLSMMALRCLASGSLLYAWWSWRGGAPPSGSQWRAAGVAGGLFFLGCHGTLSWAEQYVPSGIAALLLATIPLFMVLLEWLLPGGARPGAGVLGGLALGFLGLALLAGFPRVGGAAVDAVGAAALLFGALCWAAGSIYARGAALPSSTVLATAMELLAGGVLLAVAGVLAGELSRLNLAALSWRPVASLLYLIVFGSVIAFSAYNWLLGVSTPARVGSYGFVNPIVALLLGWLVGGEALTARVVIAAIVVLGGVALLIGSRSGSAPRHLRHAA